jgi:outer membrane protein assembly factor BamA
LLASAVAASAQWSSRAAEIEAARDAKARAPGREDLNDVEKRLIWLKEEKIIERINAGIFGLRYKIGGMATGEGFAAGPEYYRGDLFRGRAAFRASSQISTKASLKHDIHFTVPRFAGGRLFVEGNALQHNYGSINYYGPGPDSEKTGRSNYRYEDLAFDGTVGARLEPRLILALSGGALRVNTGPGADDHLASSEQHYGPGQAPGIDRQTRFWRAGMYAEFDYRDYADGPRQGGHYTVQYDFYDDRLLGRHDFHRLEADIEQYLPLFNKRRVFALRGKSVLTYTRRDQAVPFYLQPVLGGADDLRGFRPYRFYDDNLLVMNAEYRWEVFSGLDMALFADAGKVFPRHGQLDFANLESSAGFGFRFNARNRVFLRIDTGFSHEGWQVWLKFNNMFSKRPLGRSSPEAIF